ncbi:MAG: serine dehydratase beta chain, partial [Gammaproteobacteria bacterium]
MFLSVFDIFKIGLGPSSSHTMGPMVAARRFLDFLRETGCTPHRVNVTLHGSLAFTGKGHHSDKAVVLGLLDVDAATIPPETIRPRLNEVAETKTLTATGLGTFNFDPEQDIDFDFTHPREGHPNALTFRAIDALETTIAEQVYWSIGGGFVVTPEESSGGVAMVDMPDEDYPYPFSTSGEMLSMGENA